jgi:membrane-bound ClpP family serine protease
MGIQLGARIIFAACGIALFLIILECIRRGFIKEKYILVWLPFGCILLLFGIFPSILVRLSGAMHLHYMTIVVLCTIIYFTVVLVYMTARLSRLREDLKSVSQSITLIGETVRELRAEIDGRERVRRDSVPE